MIYRTIPALLAALALPACYEMSEPDAAVPATELAEPEPAEQPATAPEPEVVIASTPASRKAEIDWTAARTDFAAQDPNLVTPQGAGTVAIPILLPEIPVTVASDGPSPLRFNQVPDGYFAVVKGEVYDIIINGTDKLVGAPDGMTAMAPGELRFEDTMTGSQITFNRYGASYLVEFACKAPVTTESCITEAEAVEAVEELLLAGTQ